MSRRKKTPLCGVFCNPSGLHRMNAITWKQMRQELEQRQEPMRQQLELEQVLLQVLELVLGLLFCRKRTKQQQR
jgi:hypothetical protein